MPNQDVVAVVLAGGQGERLSVLTEPQALPAVPFAGKYRIIDFTLSNCVNSGIYDVMVLTQYRPLSLHDHIGNGKPWDLDRLHGGVRIVSPYLGRKEGGWDRGTADAVYQNLSELMEHPADNVLVLAGDHVYKMDYRQMLDFHLEKGADVTLATFRVPIEEAHRFGIVTIDEDGRIIGFEEKPRQPKSNLVSMGVYIFNKEALAQRLNRDAPRAANRYDFGRNVLPRMLQDGDKVFAFPYEAYWRDVGTVQSYWEANMELLEDAPSMDLYDRSWVVYTRSEERPPAVLYASAKTGRSLISHGCQIAGQVIHSILSPGVVIEEGAIVRDSIIMVDTVIGKNSVIDRAIIDTEVVIGPNCQIGTGEDSGPNRLDPESLSTGLTVVGKRSRLPEGLKVGRNCKIGTDLRPEDFSHGDIASGETIESTAVLT